MYFITQAQGEDIAERASEIDSGGGSDVDVRFRPSYSGRGMYGDTCIGWDLPSTGYLVALGAAIQDVIGEDDRELAEALAGSFSLDDMGRGVIAYARRFKIDAELAAMNGDS